MFDVGFSELVLIALLALILLGPQRLPEVARAAGKWLARIRHFVNNVKHDIDREMRNAEILELEKLRRELDDTRRVLQESSSKVFEEITKLPGDGAVTSPPPSAETIAPPSLLSEPDAPLKKRKTRRPGVSSVKRKTTKKHGGPKKARRR